MTNDYAMSSKARSLFSKHLTLDQLRNMSTLGSVQNVAAYLKNETRYGNVLSDIDERVIHRGSLEARIRLQGQREFLQLMRYVRKGHTNFYHYYTKRREIEQLLYVIYSIHAQTSYTPEEYIEELNDYLSIDVQILSKITTFEDLVAYLKSTDFSYVFDKPLPNINEYEDVLNEYYRKYVHSLIADEHQADEIQKLFDMDDELLTVEHVYRLKKFYSVASEDILPRIRYHPYFIQHRSMKRWIETYDADEFLNQFMQSSYIRYLDNVPFRSIENMLKIVRYRIMKHYLRFSTNSNVTLLAYMSILRYEIDDIIDVIEGVRYQMPSDEIMKLLTKQEG